MIAINIRATRWTIHPTTIFPKDDMSGDIGQWTVCPAAFFWQSLCLRFPLPKFAKTHVDKVGSEIGK